MFILITILVTIYAMACAAIITLFTRVIYPWLKRHPFWGRSLTSRKG